MPATAPCTIFFADLVRSRRLGRQRAAVQNRIRVALGKLNARYHRPDILSPFEVREGDAIRAVLAHPAVVLDAWWQLDAAGGAGALRYGIGYGELTTFRSFPDDADGPAYYHARDALEAATEATRRGLPGVVFRGFDSALEPLRRKPSSDQLLGALSFDRSLSTIGTLLAELRTRFTPPQWEAMTLMREPTTQRAVAERLTVSEPAISKRLHAAAWATYRAAEDALLVQLAAFRTTKAWR